MSYYSQTEATARNALNGLLDANVQGEGLRQFPALLFSC